MLIEIVFGAGAAGEGAAWRFMENESQGAGTPNTAMARSFPGTAQNPKPHTPFQSRRRIMLSPESQMLQIGVITWAAGKARGRPLVNVGCRRRRKHTT